ncbi:hypothetical protein ACFUNF_34945 [Streptomyces sp. NPDC057291]|uniref:hypothetical protein n=1 Tax=Streptomyces sp. NPDC057291 TaxID=3346087 RepID=UPI003624CA58
MTTCEFAEVTGDCESRQRGITGVLGKLAVANAAVEVRDDTNLAGVCRPASTAIRSERRATARTTTERVFQGFVPEFALGPEIPESGYVPELKLMGAMDSFRWPSCTDLLSPRGAAAGQVNR